MDNRDNQNIRAEIPHFYVSRKSRIGVIVRTRFALDLLNGVSFLYEQSIPLRNFVYYWDRTIDRSMTKGSAEIYPPSYVSLTIVTLVGRLTINR